VADLLSRLPAPFVDLADDTPEATSQLHRLIATGRVEIDNGVVYPASGVLRDAQNWRAIRDVVHQVDAEHRLGGKMADDDVVDVAVRALRKFPALVAEGARLKAELAEALAEVAAYEGRPEGGLPGWKYKNGTWRRQVSDRPKCFLAAYSTGWGISREGSAGAVGKAPSLRARMRAAEDEARRLGWLVEGHRG
jgi:hypothetical protein